MTKPVKITVEYDDGSTKTYDTTDGGHHRSFNSHREDPSVKGRIVEFWTGHIIGWNEGRVARESS